MQLDFEEIKKLIPQRFPFIMIDKVLEVEPGNDAVCNKKYFRQRHFFLVISLKRPLCPAL